ncbi:hypothetical protein Tco_1077037 [Tanacetum coccineum]
MAIYSSSSSSSSDNKGEKYEFQNYDLKCREIKINNLKIELEKVVKERDEFKVKIEKWEESSKSLNKLLNSQMNANDKNGLGYGTQMDEMSNKFETDSEISMSIFEVRLSDEEITSANDRFSKADGYHAVPSPITGNFLTPRADISFTGLDKFAIRKKIIESKTTELKSDTSKSKTSETVGKTNDANTKNPKSVSELVVSNPKINKDSVIIEDWNSDDEEKEYEIQTVRPETQTVKTRDDKNGQTSQKQGIGFKKVKACFVCKSTDYLIKDCNFHDKKSQEPKLKNVVNTGQREGKPVRDNTKRVNHQNFLKYPHLSKTFVPSGVQTRIGLHRPSASTASPSISTARPVSAAKPSINTARPVCTTRPSINTTRPSINTARPISTTRPNVSTARPIYATKPTYPRMDNVRPRGSCSPIKRAVVNTGKGKMDTDLKKSIWVWRPKGNYLDHVSKDSGSFMLKKVEASRVSWYRIMAVVDSRCSSHITSNKAYLSDYEDFNGGFVAFGSDPKEGEILRTSFEEEIQKVSLVRESMKEKLTDFVTPTKAPREAQEEEISLSFRGGSRKGINIAKTAQDEFNNEREAFMKDKVKDASSESEIGVDAIPTATKPPTIFHNVADAKSLWEAIKSRFGGNVESKKMQKNVLKHQFENAKRNQKRVKGILLLAIPDEYLLKFHNVVDTKSLWEAIKSSLDTKAYEVQKNSYKSIGGSWCSNIKGRYQPEVPKKVFLLHGNQIALIMRNKPDIDEIDIDDLYNNLRVYEDEMKRSSSSTSTSQNLAFLSSENTSSTNEVSTASGDFEVSTAGGINQVSSTPCAHDVACSFFAQPTTSPQLKNEDFQQIDGDDLEELDLRWQVAMLTVRVKKFIQRTGRNLDFKEKRPVSLDKSKIECYNRHRKGHFARECKSGRNQGRRSYGDNSRSNAPTNKSLSQALVAQDGLGGYNWSNDFEVEPVNYALMSISSSSLWKT